MSHQVRLNEAQLRELLSSANGPVGRDLLRRALRVESAAKRRVKVDHGRLRASITHEVLSEGGHLSARVGTNVVYAHYVHGGTGVYGPHHHVIVPRHGSVLSFTAGGRRVTVRWVRGQPANPYLLEALREAARAV